MEICGDNRFEIIAKAKADLLEGTNIETSEDEMKVLDSFLFRCWQMGWLDKYDRKTENSSEKPNNCEAKNYCDDCLYTDTCDSKEFFYACTSKPTISKMEQVEDEPQEDVPILTAEEWAKIKKTMPESRLILFDDDGIAFEPQTERSE